jgi:hypothetical protein
MSYQSSYGRYNPNRANRWEDWANLVLAVWLFFSPWILQFGSVSAAGVGASNAAWNAWIFGVIVFLVALSALGRMELWQEWINILLGAWIFVAPWALGFAAGPLPAASWDHWIVGALIVILSGINVAQMRAAPREDLSLPHGGHAPRPR